MFSERSDMHTGDAKRSEHNKTSKIMRHDKFSFRKIYGHGNHDN